MKKFMMALLLATTLNQASAQSVTLRDVFRQMPDSLMIALGDDSLTIRMNPSLRTDMLLMDSTVVMIETFTVDSIYGQSRVHYFTTAWQPIAAPQFTEAQSQRIKRFEMQNILKRDDELLNKR